MLTTWALLVLSALFGEHDRTERMIVRAGCGAAPLFSAAVDLHAANTHEASTLVSLYKFEGHCSTKAVGDFDDKGRPTSFGFGQQHGAPGEWAWILDDVDAQVRIALEQVRASFGACRRLPVSERLSLYARGRCDSARGQELSRHRMALARRLQK